MCCGKTRTQFRGTIPNLRPPSLGPMVTGPQPQFSRHAGATFEYIGKTRLTVTGPVTGRQYLFDSPGAQVEVDLRDRASVAAVPVLRQVGQSFRKV